MNTKLIATALVGLLLAAPAAALEEDAETRWHEAYVLEVIDGKIDEAAKTYLALMEDPDMPERLARETEFRFAVCCVLLGRADEARSRLAGLLAREDLRAEFRARIESYSKALEGIGVGTELDRKLQELLFELGRAKGMTPNPEVYRDFQIIGTPAVPFLEQLLGHPDLALRNHAYRILCAMNEPVVATRLPETNWQYLWYDLSQFLERNEGCVPAVEKLLLALSEKDLAQRVNATFWKTQTLSLEFLHALSIREGMGRLLHVNLTRRKWTVATVALAARLVREGGDDVASYAALHLAEVASRRLDFEFRPKPGFLGTLVRRLGTFDRALPRPATPGNHVQDWMRGLTRLAVSLPADTVQQEIEALVDRSETARKADPECGIAEYCFDGLTRALEPLEERSDPTWLARIYRRWLALGGRPPSTHLRHLLRRLPFEEAKSLIKATYDSGAGLSFALEEPRDLEVLFASLEAMSVEHRQNNIGAIRRRITSDPVTPELGRALFRALPRLLEVTKDYEIHEIAMLFPSVSIHAGPEEARAMLLSILRAVVERKPDEATNAIGLLFGQPYRTSIEIMRTQLQTVRAPSLASAAEIVDEKGRNQLVHLALSLLRDSDDKPQSELGEAVDHVAAFLRPNIGLVPVRRLREVVARPELFPLQDWAHLPREVWWKAAPVPTERADAAAVAYRDRPEDVNILVLYFLGDCASPDVFAEVVDHLLERHTDDDRLLRMLLTQPAVIVTPQGVRQGVGRGRPPISPARLEKTLESLLAREDVPLVILAHLGDRMSEERPTEKLFPLVKRLLASGDPEFIPWGTRIAQSLGSKELVPSLVDLLDSLDGSIRESAKRAIDSIEATERIKQEYRERK